MDINAFNEKLVRNDSRYDLVQYIHKVNELSNNPKFFHGRVAVLCR